MLRFPPPVISFLLFAFAMSASGCALGGDGQSIEFAAAETPEVVEDREGLDAAVAVETEGPVDNGKPVGGDLALSITTAKASPELVLLNVHVQSLDSDEPELAEVLIETGEGLAYLSLSETCSTQGTRIRCTVLESGDSDTFVVAFEVDPESSDPSATFAVQNSNVVATDPDLSNNAVTAVFVGVGLIEPVAVSEPTILVPKVEAPTPTIPPVPEQDVLPEYSLEVHSDGCGVIRSGEIGDDLTWVVTDLDGFQVLGRNAAGETRYRYFTPGTYQMVLETWGGSYYVPVSNEVTITC